MSEPQTFTRQIMLATLRSMAVEMPRLRHPNRAHFRGLLTLVDAASDRPPAGARGHRVLLRRPAAEAALASLLGMAVDYTPSLDGHDARRKVGIITSAEIVSVSRFTLVPSRETGSEQRETGLSAIAVEGYFFARDFPDVVREIRAAGRALGMSYELVDAEIADVSASVWEITAATFTGAAVLRRDKAAYTRTWIELTNPAPASGRFAAAVARFRRPRVAPALPQPALFTGV